MMRNRWIVAVLIAQIVSILIVMNRPSGSDWVVFVLLIGSSFLSVEGLRRSERWP